MIQGPDLEVRRVAALTGILAFLVAALFAPGHIDNVDSRVCMHAAEDLLDHASFALVNPDEHERRGEWTTLGPDGRVYSKFGLGASLVLTPFVLLGRVLAAVLPAGPGPWEEIAVSLSSAVYLGLGTFLLILLVSFEWKYPPGPCCVGALAWAFGTYQAVYAGSTYRETVLGLVVIGTVFSARRAVRSNRAGAAVGAGALAGLLILTKPAMLVGVPFLLMTLAGGGWVATSKRLSWAAAPLAVCGLVILWTNTCWFGGPFRSGYTHQARVFANPLTVGLRAYVLDPNLSLPLFAPAWVLGLAGIVSLARRSGWTVVAAAGFLVSTATLHAAFVSYHGGTSYGPRYLLPGIALMAGPGVAAILACGKRVPRRAAACLVVLAIGAQLPGQLVPPYEYHTIRGRVEAAGGDATALPAHQILNLHLLRWKLVGRTEEYPLGDVLGPGWIAPYPVPHGEQGLSPWWARATRRGFRAAIPAAAALLVVGLAAGWGILRRLRGRGRYA